MALVVPLVGAIGVAAPFAVLAARAWKRLDARRRRALVGALAFAAPIAWLAVFSLVEQAVLRFGPFGRGIHATFVVLALAVFLFAATWAARLPPERLYLGAAVLPAAGVVAGSVKLSTTLGGPLAVFYSLVLLGSAALLPWALVAAMADASRRFVVLLTAGILLLGGLFTGALAVAAAREDGLGLATAERTWRLEVEPEGGGTYTLVVPFPVGTDDAAEVARLWRDEVDVERGVVFLRTLDDRLEITATGPVALSSRIVFHGSPAERASLASTGMPDVLAEVDGEPAAARVRWTAEAPGVSCPVAVDARLVAREPVALAPPGALWPCAVT